MTDIDTLRSLLHPLHPLQQPWCKLSLYDYPAIVSNPPSTLLKSCTQTTLNMTAHTSLSSASASSVWAFWIALAIFGTSNIMKIGSIVDPLLFTQLSLTIFYHNSLLTKDLQESIRFFCSLRHHNNKWSSTGQVHMGLVLAHTLGSNVQTIASTWLAYISRTRSHYSFLAGISTLLAHP